ncbi:hypothetical protein KIW84_045665 [Lathyrus oleraceus]|uniref:Uncharacterized protein n=1 Tax=Pisum sativum TaxID=3888 RepID=A0A9D4XJP3_PEA|nr:hypothetical protein KIW84_045665 [Pisum sativum]
MVNDEGELVHYDFYVDVEPVNVAKALKDSIWMKVMNEELKSIEVNHTWSLVKLPQGKKEIDVKRVGYWSRKQEQMAYVSDGCEM